MATHVVLRHQTRYSDHWLVALSPHVIRLRPAPHCRTPILSYSLKIVPANHFLNWQQDPFGNYLARLVSGEDARARCRRGSRRRDVGERTPSISSSSRRRRVSFCLRSGTCQGVRAVPGMAAAGRGCGSLRSVYRSPRRTVDFLVASINGCRRMSGTSFGWSRGCRRRRDPDARLGLLPRLGWLLVQMLRHLGLAARFVSGYLIQLKPDVKSLDGPSGTEVDFTDLHAWTEVYLPGAGWIGLDPTSGLWPVKAIFRWPARRIRSPRRR